MIKFTLTLLISLSLCVFVASFAFGASNDPFPTTFEEFDKLVSNNLIEQEPEPQSNQQACLNPEIDTLAVNEMTVKSLNIPVANQSQTQPAFDITNITLIATTVLALLLALWAILYARRASKVTPINTVTDHWYRSVIHPHCYQPLLTLLQSFEKHMVKAQAQGINQEQMMKLLWQLQEQKTAILNSIAMVISDQAVVKTLNSNIEDIFAQMESDCMARIDVVEGDNGKGACVVIAMNKISQLFGRLHQQMIESD